MITRLNFTPSPKRHLLHILVTSILLISTAHFSKCDSSMNSNLQSSHSHTGLAEPIDAHTNHHLDPPTLNRDGEHGESGEPEDGSEAPPKPTDLQVIRMNDTSVVLRWETDQIPIQNLQFFKVQYKATKKDASWKTDNQEIAPQVKAYQINGLRPGNYFFKVQAVYDNDDSVSSDQIKYRLRAKTKIPQNEWPEMKAPEIYWYEEKPDYLRFKWKYKFKPADDAYYGYLVYYRSAYAMSDFTIYNTLDESVEIAELEPDTPYEVKVVAYNKHTVSEFSDIKKVKTSPKSNFTSSTTLPPTPAKSTTPSTPVTTKRPTLPSSSIAPENPSSSNDVIKQSPVVPTNANNGQPTNQVTQKPTLIITPANNSTTIQSISSTINDLFFGGQNDTTVAIRYSLLVLLPILCIVFASLCLISCRHNRHKDASPPTAHDAMQFALEINGYFKNSFPNVENDYLSVPNADTKHGFVNNHPHIHDFA